MRQSNRLTCTLRTWPALALLALAAPLAAQEPTPAVPATTVKRDDDSRALKRVLHLNGGTTLRAIARKSESGTWEYKHKGKWLELQSFMVTDVQLERVVLKELRERKKALKKGDLNGEAELAAWMFSNGLLTEALDASDRILALAPDHSLTLAALDGNAHRFSVPSIGSDAEGAENCENILRWASLRSTSSREMAITQLERSRDRKTLLAELSRALNSSKVGRRSFAPLALRRLFPGEQVQALLARAVLDSSVDVRRNSAQALGSVGDPAVAVPVLKAMTNSRSGRVRVQAAQALGYMRYPAVVKPLMTHLSTLQASRPGNSVPHSHIFVGRQFAYIQDFDVEVAAFQAVADPSINVLIEGDVLDAGVVGLGQVGFASEKRAVRAALQNITGANPGRYTKDWLKWWDKNESTYAATEKK
jgi:hypothetical protein